MIDAGVHHARAAVDVLFSDDAMVVVDKRAGQLAVPGRGEERADCTWARVRAQWPDALVVHRLDQATSGLMLFARGLAMQRALSRAFAERRVDKRYVAVVHGVLADDEGCIDLPLGADWPQRPRQRVDYHAGKPSTSGYSVLQRDPSAGRTRVALHPLTGRTHQLRVHLAAIGHPIVGDALYGRAHEPAGRLLLHAERLGFQHPVDCRPLQLFRSCPF
jgi:tRNA pseudouridine32 synthase / 23S rRNA pseudouridine746 synthase